MTVARLKDLADTLDVAHPGRVRKSRLVELLLARADAVRAALAAPQPEVKPSATPPLRDIQDLERTRLCWKWTECVLAQTEDGWDVAVLPSNTVLFHGTSASFPDDVLPRAPAYFASLDAASHYAFRSDTLRGEIGKVIAAVSLRPISLLAITPGNVERLSRLPDFPEEQFRFAFPFDEECDRRSHYLYDVPVTAWICRVAPTLPFRVQGWAFPAPRCFHDEVVVCDPSGLARIPLEVRYSQDLYGYVLITWDGRIVDVVPAQPCLGWQVFFRAYDLYKPEPGRTADAYLFEPEWQRRIRAVAHGKAPRPPDFIDFPALLGRECDRASPVI